MAPAKHLSGCLGPYASTPSFHHLTGVERWDDDVLEASHKKVDALPMHFVHQMMNAMTQSRKHFLHLVAFTFGSALVNL